MKFTQIPQKLRRSKIWNFFLNKQDTVSAAGLLKIIFHILNSFNLSALSMYLVTKAFKLNVFSCELNYYDTKTTTTCSIMLIVIIDLLHHTILVTWLIKNPSECGKAKIVNLFNFATILFWHSFDTLRGRMPCQFFNIAVSINPINRVLWITSDKLFSEHFCYDKLLTRVNCNLSTIWGKQQMNLIFLCFAFW